MKKKNLIIGIILVLVVAIFIFSFQSKNESTPTLSKYNIQVSDSPSESRELSQEEISSGNFREVELAISGMFCPYCSSGVSSSLLQLDGIIKTNITLEKRGGTVVYDSTKLNKNDIVNSGIFDGVYKAKIIDDKQIS